jgi:tetratricopeptide (TPR) repeat protein
MKYLGLTGFLVLLLLVFSGLEAQQSTASDATQWVTSQDKDWKTALSNLEKKIADNPDDVEAQFLKGLLLFERADVTAAREVFLNIVRRFPYIPEAYNNLAVIYTAEGDYEKARQALLAAIANDYPQAQANLGDLYSKLAADAYRQALNHNPDDSASRAKLVLLENLFASEGP